MRFFARKGVDKLCNILTTDRISLSFFAVKTIFMLSRRAYCVHGFSVGRVKAVRRTAAHPYQRSRKKPHSRKQNSRRHRTLPQMKPFSISDKGRWLYRRGRRPGRAGYLLLHGGREAAGTAGHRQGMAAGSALCVVKPD